MQRLMLTLVMLTFAVDANATNGDELCPPGYRHRTPEEVLADHRAWLAVGDVDRVVNCNYTEDAVVIHDGPDNEAVDQGRDAIRESLRVSSTSLAGRSDRAVGDCGDHLESTYTHGATIVHRRHTMR